MDNFEIKANEYLENYKYESCYPVYKCLVNKFLTFYSAKGKAIEEYTEEDFKTLLNSCNNANNFSALKYRIVDLLEKTGYYNLTQYVKDIFPNEIEQSYAKSFEELDENIETVRLEKFPFLKGAPKQEKCDSLTMGQVILYLAWIGVPQRMIAQIPLSAIDLDNNVVDAGRKFSFANNKKIIEVFTLYKNAKSFLVVKPSKNKNFVDFREEDYLGDRIIRPRERVDIIKIENSIKTIINRLSRTFPFIENYLQVQRAGQFSRGYEKFIRGENPDFTNPTNIWEYFGAIAETDAQLYSLKMNWTSYVAWRKRTG